jgi:cellulose 1,4-beta-cellobiosidase
VSLAVGSESGFPSGITSGGFSPSSITGSGTSTLTMKTTTSAAPYALSLTVTATAGSLSHTASTTLLLNLAAPASLTASPGASQVSLSWTASNGASSYHVKRALISGGPYISVGCVTGTAFTDTGVTSGTTYYYVVSADYQAGPDAGGESADSPEASATPSAPLPPAAPTNLTASPGGPKGSVKLNWKQSTSSGITQNYIYRRTSTGTYSSTPTAKINATTSYTDKQLGSGTTYCYEVTALNSAGESAKSNEACARAK